MLLENLELGKSRAAAQEELEELAQALQAADFTASVAPIDGKFHSKLEESAQSVAVDVLNLVLEHVESDSVELVIGGAVVVLKKWAKRRKHFRDRDGSKATAVIWGPDGRPIQEIELPEPDESDDSLSS